MEYELLRLVIYLVLAYSASGIVAAISYFPGLIVGGGARKEVGAEDVRYSLRYDKQSRGLCLIFGLLSPILGGYFVDQGLKDRGSPVEATAAIVAGIVLGLAAPLATYGVLRSKVVITKDGISEGRLLGTLRLKWNEITAIHYIGLSGGYFILKGRDSKTLLVRKDLDGFEYFVDACYERLPSNMVEKAFKDGEIRPPEKTTPTC